MSRSNYLTWLRTKLFDTPGYSSALKDEVAKEAAKYYSEISPEEYAYKIYKKAEGAHVEYGEPDYEDDKVTEEREDERVDDGGWKMAGRYSKK